jgi:uncharacterized protein
MKYLKFLLIGVVFGIALAKAEIISWYRIYEMFMFKSFHMYGVIGSAVTLGVIIVFLAKKYKWRTIDGEGMVFSPKEMSFPRYLIGGTIFGLGWALAGACPGPMYILLGSGFPVILVVIASALVGTLAYGLLRDKLPH